MRPQDRARQLRPIIEQAAVSLDDETALEAIELYPVWAVGVLYTVGERVSYNGKLYRVEQEHTSQADWTPDITPALYTEVVVGEIPVWRQPTGAQDAYMVGDRVYYPNKGDTVYMNTVDYNVYAPDVFGWVAEE